MGLPGFSFNFSPLGVQAQEMQALPWPWVFSSKGFAGGWYCSVPPQLLSYCLSLTWCMCSVQSGLGAGNHPEFMGLVPLH